MPKFVKARRKKRCPWFSESIASGWPDLASECEAYTWYTGVRPYAYAYFQKAFIEYFSTVVRLFCFAFCAHSVTCCAVLLSVATLALNVKYLWPKFILDRSIYGEFSLSGQSDSTKTSTIARDCDKCFFSSFFFKSRNILLSGAN